MFVVGLNYWPSYCPIYFWEKYRGEEIDDDLRVMRELGVNSVRVFLLTRVFMDSECGVKEHALERLLDFLDRCYKYGLKVYLTLIVGHMSGMNFRVVNGYMYSREAIDCLEKFFQEIASRVKDHPALEAYVIGNEITIYEKPSSREEYREFLRRIYSALKKVDPKHRVTSGSGLYYPYHVGAEPETEAEILDYLAPHMYNYDNDVMRQGYAYIFKLKHCLSTRKPVIYEELGFSSYQYGDEGQFLFLRPILYSILANGAQGFMIWCFSDFDKEEWEPYINHPYELGFGIVKANREQKPSALLIKEISSLEEKYMLSNYKPIEDPVGILIPQYMYKDVEFVNKIIEKVDLGTIIKVLYQSFTMLKMAGYNPIIVNEDTFDKTRLKALIVPSIPILKATTWRKLLRLVENGLTLYYSVAISVKEPHHAPTHLWEELFGVIPAQTPGYITPMTNDIKTEILGEEIVIPGLKTAPQYTIHLGIKVKPVDAEVIVPCNNNPLILRAKRGKGEAILVTEPIEYYLIEAIDANTRYKPYRIYRKILENKLKPRTPYDPRLEVIEATSGDSRIIYMINHSYEEVVVEASGTEPILVHGRKNEENYVIEPRGVAIVKH
ncbi:cellulase family glycosylhydrolase [Desulfurococcaceae archaeon MEX13E-LK6-19]|nr:cellulase family glycosylhydrolase [Desulfurococcaceae archaeon MEX13E-LK6-19]